MTENPVYGSVIGVTDDGYPLVTEGYSCSHWTGAGVGVSPVRECWYCKYADFRKRTDLTMTQSVCRCPANRREILPGSANEQTREQGGTQHV